ncbi:Gp15 family bacteriophage protein [Facklamia sp. P13064]|uniref:Gp15 family bacteriophage protein n=1 Tax=Facklamia sp. P13064 TaxID=3421953 RepID=UPI003D182219
MLQFYLPLRDYIEINGKEYGINSYFNVLLKVIDVLQSDQFDEADKLVIASVFMFGEPNLREKYPDDSSAERIGKEWERLGFNSLDPALIAEAIEKVFELYGGQNFEGQVYDITGEPMPKEMLKTSGSDEKLIDYNQDSDAIYASFMQVYNIDLIEQQNKLHYAKFKALLDNLPSDCAVGRLVEIRSWSEENDNRDRKDIMRELKAKNKLKGG